MKLKLLMPLKGTPKFNSFGVDFFLNGKWFYKSQGLLGHNGLDFEAKHGTPIYASHDGVGLYQIDNHGGHGVVIITDKEYEDVNGASSLFKTIYWHLVDPLKEPKYASPLMDKLGVTLKAGDLIGYANNTGTSTGSHLHFGLKKVQKGENLYAWSNIEQNNGYMGATDPAPYLEIPLSTENESEEKVKAELESQIKVLMMKIIIELQKKLLWYKSG